MGPIRQFWFYMYLLKSEYMYLSRKVDMKGKIGQVIGKTHFSIFHRNYSQLFLAVTATVQKVLADRPLSGELVRRYLTGICADRVRACFDPEDQFYQFLCNIQHTKCVKNASISKHVTDWGLRCKRQHCFKNSRIRSRNNNQPERVAILKLQHQMEIHFGKNYTKY